MGTKLPKDLPIDGTVVHNYAVGVSGSQDVDLAKGSLLGIKAKAVLAFAGAISASYSGVDSAVEKWTGTARAGIQTGINVGVGIEIKPRIPILAIMLIGEAKYTHHGKKAGVSQSSELRFVPFGVTLLEDGTNASPKAQKMKAFSSDPSEFFKELVDVAAQQPWIP